MNRSSPLESLRAEVVSCRLCPRLVEWREEVARTRRRAFADEEYWGRPVPSFGDPAAKILIVGLAPAAHGANRTGRMFTGDRSGEWLFGALHRAGLATRPESVHRDDALELEGAWLTAAVRCAPPGNRPTAEERDRCQPYLEREMLALAELQVIVALGGFAWGSVLRALRAIDWDVPSPKPRFGHEAEATVVRSSREPDGVREIVLIGSYHPSQQNTFTGRLTQEMFDSVWRRAVAVAG